MNRCRSNEQRGVGFFGGILPLLLLIFLVGPVTAKQNPELSYRSLPGWALDIDIPAPNKDRMRATSDGIYHLIDDTQIKIGAKGSDYFLRTTKKVIDRSGLEDASQIQLSFDPETENLALHRAAVWRDGKLIDQTATASIEILRRESELEDSIITGQKTANLRLENVKVGDVTDFAWSLNEKKSAWPGHFFGRYDLGWSVPVAMTHLRVTMPSSLKLHAKLTNGAPSHEETSEEGTRIFTWNVADLEPFTWEQDAPKWIKQNPSVELSTMPNWSEVVGWARPFYDVDPTLPPDLKAKVDKIAAGTDDPKLRTSRALWLVQDSVRYTSLSIGIGGFRPRPPAVTWNSGYGDCKDKTTLLIVVLKRLGISALPALTDIDKGPGLINLQPRADAFDHVIVRVDGLGKPVWLDPTGSHEGGIIPNIADKTYGYALPLTDGQDKLQTIPAPTPEIPTIEVAESHVRSAKGVSIDISASYKMDEANIKRSSVVSSSLTSLEEGEEEYYKSAYPGIKRVGELTVTDDRDQNILTVNQSFFLPATAKDYDDTLVTYLVNGWSVSDIYETPAASERKTPIALSYQINRKHVIKLTTPDTRPELPDDEVIKSKAFEFNRSSVRDGDIATIEMNLIGKKISLEAKDVAAYRKDATKLDDLTYEYIDLDDEFGFIGSELFVILVALYFIGGLSILYVAVQNVLAAEAAGTVAGQFRPIGVGKFVILSFATFSMYASYWFWRCWRRYRKTDNAEISPFWRAFFSIFWVYALFDASRQKADIKNPIWLGIVIAIGYFLSYVISNAAGQYGIPLNIGTVAFLVGIVILVPMVQQINALNDRVLVAENSQFTKRDWLALGCGLPFTIITLIA